MLRFTTLIAITIAAAQPAIAAPAKEYGQGDGERFEYTTELRANGNIHIAGVVLGSGQQFVLDVTPKGHVDGVFGDTPVRPLRASDTALVDTPAKRAMSAMVVCGRTASL